MATTNDKTADVKQKQTVNAEKKEANETKLPTKQPPGVLFDPGSSLIIKGLPTSLINEPSEAMKEVIVELLEDAFSAGQYIEEISPLPADKDADNEEDAAQALIEFKSRLHKNKLFTLRSKLETPLKFAQVTREDWNRYGLNERTKEDVPIKTQTPNAEETVASKKQSRWGGKVETSSTTHQVAVQQPTTVIDWEGAPEFQWKVCEEPGDEAKLVIENVSIGDLFNVYLYQTVMRARRVEFVAVSDNNKGGGDHNILRRGTLNLHFNNDYYAMVAALSSLVSVRTRPNKPLTIYLPQTATTQQYQTQLEQKLGRVNEPNLRSYQLLVRGIRYGATEDDVKNAFSKSDREKITEVLLKNNGKGYPCAVVTFTDPQTAIWAHLKQDEVQTAINGGYSRVFSMTSDINADTLLLKWERTTSEQQPSSVPTVDMTQKRSAADAGFPSRTFPSKQPAFEMTANVGNRFAAGGGIVNASVGGGAFVARPRMPVPPPRPTFGASPNVPMRSPFGSLPPTPSMQSSPYPVNFPPPAVSLKESPVNQQGENLTAKFEEQSHLIKLLGEQLQRMKEEKQNAAAWNQGGSSVATNSATFGRPPVGNDHTALADLLGRVGVGRNQPNGTPSSNPSQSMGW